MMAERAGATVYLLGAGLIAAYVIARAALVPMVHDECASVLWFVQPGEWLPYQAHWDANNHFLGSGIGALLYHVFGPSRLALRLGSTAAFLVYAWAAWRLGGQVRDRSVRCCLHGALLLCPFVLDFFSLFRGYAIEMAGWLMALDGLLRYASSRSTRHLVLALCGMLIADAAIIALLPVWAMVLAMALVLMWSGRDRLRGAARTVQPVLVVALGLLPIAYAARIAWELKTAGLLYHGSTDGFFAVTVQSLCGYVLGVPSVLMAGFVVLLLSLSSIVALSRAQRSRSVLSPLALVHVMLWADVLLRILMSAALEVNFPEDRAGIHFVPLALLCIGFAIDDLAAARGAARWAAVTLLLLPLRTLLTVNMDHTVLWREQSIPFRFAHRVDELQAVSPRPLVVGGHHQLALAWPMNAHWQGLNVPSLQVDGFPNGDHDLRVVDGRWLSEASIGFHPIDSAAGPGLWLLERDTPMRFEVSDTMRIAPRAGMDEFIELAHPPDTLMRDHATFLDVRVPVDFDGVSPDVVMVIEVTDSTGAKLVYAAQQLSVAMGPGRGEPFRYALAIPVLPDATRAVVYLYNPRHLRIGVGAGSVALSIRTG